MKYFLLFHFAVLALFFGIAYCFDQPGRTYVFITIGVLVSMVGNALSLIDDLRKGKENNWTELLKK